MPTTSSSGQVTSKGIREAGAPGNGKGVGRRSFPIKQSLSHTALVSRFNTDDYLYGFKITRRFKSVANYLAKPFNSICVVQTT